MINSRLKTLQPIYHAKVWEEDYRKQVELNDNKLWSAVLLMHVEHNNAQLLYYR